MTNDNKKIMRWVQMMQQFPHSIIYLPGKNNVVADALSRAWDFSGGLNFIMGEMLGSAGLQPQSACPLQQRAQSQKN
jgi:hypothetical protein